MSKKFNPWPIIGIALIVFIVGAGIAVKLSPASHPVPSSTQNGQPSGRMIMIHSGNWNFYPDTIKAKQGEDVSLHLMGIEGNHGFAVPGLGINESMSQGENKMIKLPTDKPGTYDFFCSVPCGSGHSDMRGTITIE